MTTWVWESMAVSTDIHLLTVFPDGPGGGNPAPIVLNAARLSDHEMQAVARSYGFECGFVLPAPAGSGCDFAMRFWVPNEEMSMCGHATVGATWLLHRMGRLPSCMARISTPSGVVEAHITGEGDPSPLVEISQPAGRVQTLDDKSAVRTLLNVLRIAASDLDSAPIVNAVTSRIKTLVPLASTEVLHRLQPDFDQVESLCGLLGSTGLYPYAFPEKSDESGGRVVHARQFPRSAGYPEDAATGVASAALAFGLLQTPSARVTPGTTVRVRQGQAMGRPSLITVRFRQTKTGIEGCWLGGIVEMAASH